MLLKQIDELSRPAHHYLAATDEIYYLGEYTTGKWADHSEINKLILNYKKKTQRKNESDWEYKQQAIRDVSEMFKESIFQTATLSKRANDATLVPMPPSSAKDSPDYDDRNLKMLNLFMPHGDIRELIVQKESRQPLHTSENRRPNYLKDNFKLNTDVKLTGTTEIWLFDDVLTKGTHYKAASDFINENYQKEKIPKPKIVGFFIARSVHPFSSQQTN